MIIFYFSDTKRILNHLIGFSTILTASNKYIVAGQVICNAIANIEWKYIADQRLETDDEGNYLYNADYYLPVEKPLTIEELQEQLAATNAILLDMYLGV